MSHEEKKPKLVSYLMLKNGSKVFLVQYRDSPNPNRKGWWIPAPELKYGQHPEDCAKEILASLGVSGSELKFHEVDSFVTRDWHVLFYYTAEISKEPVLGAEYEKGEWFDVEHLPEGKAFAHGNWERDLVVKLAKS